MASENRNRELVLKEASISIDIVVRRLKALRNSMLSRAGSYFRSLVDLQAKGNIRASAYADEIAQLRNLAQKLYYGEILLEKVKVRLEVISLVSPVGEELRVADQLISEVRSAFEGIKVDLTEMDRIQTQVSEIMESTVAPQVELPTQVSEAKSQEVRQILAEASTLAAERIAKEFPQVPVPEKVPEAKPEEEIVKEQLPLEERLFTYLSGRSGEYSPDEASKALGASKEEIARALRSLSDKGRIVLEEPEKESEED